MKQVDELLTLCECDKFREEGITEDCEYCQIAHDIAHFG